MALNSVKKFVKPKSSKDGGTVIIKKSGGGSAAFDSTNLNVVNINANNGNIDNIKSKNIYSDNVFSTLVEADDIKSFNINTNTINSDVGNINKVNASDVVTNKLTVNDEANIQKIINSYLQSDNIVCDDLTVNKTAHFFELVVDKMRSIEGTQINTAANCVVDYVEWLNSYGSVTTDINSVDHFRLYWRKSDQEGREISNKWKVYDQAFCQSFNADGSTAETSNRYYWRLVKQVDNGSLRYINFDKGEVKSIQPSTFQIKFDDFFWYGPLTTSDPSYQPYTSFQPELENNKGIWDSSTYTWEPESTSYGLRLIPEQLGIYGNTFHFVTHDDTKLTVGVYYVDGSYEFFKWTDANGKQIYKDSYDVTTKELTSIQYIMIYTSVFDLWEECHWIDVSNVVGEYVTEANFNSTPTVGDNVAQLGYQYTRITNPTQDDINRASAIIIAAYHTPDEGVPNVLPALVPPSYAHYQNIIDFDLGSHRKTYFDATGAHIVGDLTVVAGGTTTPLEQYIKSLQDSNPIKCRIRNQQDIELDLVVLQTDNNHKIQDINGWPGSIGILLQNNNVIINPIDLDPANGDSLYINLFGNDPTYGRTIDMLSWVQQQTTDNYEGIYITNIIRGNAVFPTVIDFNWRNTSEPNGGQTILNSSFSINGTYNYTYTDPTTQQTVSKIYEFSKNVPVATVQFARGTDGQNGQLFLLSPVMEKAEVNDEGVFNADLKYKIAHIDGTTVTYPTPTSTQELVIKAWNDGTMNPDLQPSVISVRSDTLNASRWNSANGWWNFTDTYNWIGASTSNKVVYYTIDLVDSNTVLDTKIVKVDIATLGFFQVTNELGREIHTTQEDLEQETLNRQSEIQRTSQGIMTSVSETYLSNADASVIYSTKGELNVKANQITAQLTDSLGRTGIDIEHGKITLDADNTEITGNLSLRAGIYYSSTYVVPVAACADRNTYHSKNLIIRPDIDTPYSEGNNYYMPGRNTYLLKDIFPRVYASDNFEVTNTIILPDARTSSDPDVPGYDGLEINIMVALTSDDSYMDEKAGYYGRRIGAYIKTQQNQGIWVPDNGRNSVGYWYKQVSTGSGNQYQVMKTVGQAGESTADTIRTYPMTSTIYPESSATKLLIQPNYYFRLKAMDGNWYVIDGLVTPI